MIGSPNFARFVYDGDGDAFGIKGPSGSDDIEALFAKFFADQGLASEPTAFDGRSDYDAFISAGIPAGGLFTGAEDAKSEEQVPLYGGLATYAGSPVSYDPCYHLACDTFANNSDTGLEQMSDAAAHAVLTFAMTTSAVNGTGQGNGNGVGNLEFDGARRQR
jgi:Zn-dependent M28 family amino/carboxypeptidase